MFLMNKTRIVATIGPASADVATMERLLEAGMNVARLNFSHGDFASHRSVIENLRQAAHNTGRRLALMADLPGPKMRIGEIPSGPVELVRGDELTLTTEPVVGTAQCVSVSFKPLPRVVKAGDRLFLNDGLIALKVVEVEGERVRCLVRSGGELSSRKGLNLPGIDLGISVFTEQDQKIVDFAVEMGLDAVSQSFVASAEDIAAVRQRLKQLGANLFVIAKIERASALDHLESIICAADGIMVARGDLGVEIPIARMALVQKNIMRMARAHGKPVITATQMLESMTEHRRPTRAEATDVANAILDGTDAVMLSAESATGLYPVEAVAMLAEIARETEPAISHDIPEGFCSDQIDDATLIARSLHYSVMRLLPKLVVVPTRSGNMARNVTRFRLPSWIVAFSTQASSCQALQFSYGVVPVQVAEELTDWSGFVRQWVHQQEGLNSGKVILTQGPSPENLSGNHKLEFIDMAK